jgi:hypothetical protein
VTFPLLTGAPLGLKWQIILVIQADATGRHFTAPEVIVDAGKSRADLI